eukprot:scaffold13840_cov92-Isochrysis_galbana.AAC.2
MKPRGGNAEGVGRTWRGGATAHSPPRYSKWERTRHVPAWGGSRGRLRRTFETEAADEHDRQHRVREQGGEPRHLAGRVDSLDHAQPDQQPRERQAAHQRPDQLARVRNARPLRPSSVAVPVAAGIGVRPTVERLHLPKLESAAEARIPRQRRRHAPEQVPQRPRHHHIVITAHNKRCNGARDAHPLERRVHALPDLAAAHLELLTHAQLEQEDGHADEQQHDDVWDQEGSAAVVEAERGEAPEVPQPVGKA